MPWVVVLGRGNWLPERGVKLGPGKHEVSNELAAKARASGLRFLVVLDEEPDVRWHGPEDGPLLLEQLKRNTPAGAYIPPPEAEVDVTGPVEEEQRVEHPCLFCPLTYPSAGALARHVEFHHPRD